MKNTYYFFLFLLISFIFPQNSQAQKLNHVLGDLLIQMPSGSNPDLLISELKNFNGLPTQLKIKRQLKTDLNLWLLHFDQNVINENHFLTFIRTRRFIDLAQFNHILTERQTVPDDPQFSQQWQWFNNSSGGGNDDADVDADLAWDITTGGTTLQGDEIVVCVMEGADREHEDLQGNLWFNANEIPDDGIDNDNNGFVDDIAGWNFAQNNGDIPFSGHGTAVSGMIGAVGNNNLGVAGINWNVKIMHVARLNTTEDGVVEAYNYPLIMRRKYNETGGSEGAFVVVTNASWGLDFGQPEDAPLWCNMYDLLGAEGILNCGATANNNVDIDVVGDLPTACPSDFMVSVTATNNQDLRTFSAYGLINVDVGAPGSAVYTLAGGGGYGSSTGTSFACPLTAGVIALLYSAPCSSIGSQALADPQSTALMIRDYLYNGVDQTPQLLLETTTGGRVNAFNSLQLMLANCGSCSTPYALNASNLTDTSAVLSWFESDSVLVADLRYKLVGDTSWIEIDDAANPYDLMGLLACSDYEFQVAATCGDTATGYSNSYFFGSGGCCFAPQNVIITQVGMNDIMISWDSTYAALGYIIKYKAESDLGSTLLQVPNSSTTIEDLSACTTYLFELATICTPDSTSEYSDTIFYTTECICEAPENIDTMNIQAESATIVWDASINADSYVFRYRKFGLIDWINYETTDSFISLDSLQFCTNYQYQIQTICPIASSGFSPSKVFKTACTVGISELEGVSNLYIYPNPVDDHLFIELNLKAQNDISVQIFNTSGQSLRSVAFQNTSYGHNQLTVKYLNDLSQGLYFVKIKIGDHSILKKIVKK